jgi:hypothetical protein
MEVIKLVNMKFNNSRQEFTEAMNYFYSRTQKRNFDIILGLIVSFVAVFLIISYEFSYMYLFLLFIGILLAAFSFFKGSIISKLRFIRDKKFNEEYTLSFDEDGIHFVTDSVKSDIVWDYYNKIWETKKFFYLFYGKELFSLIPKRAILNEIELNELRDMFKNNINEYINLQ